jgi:low affinity Fe/Cu permease
MSVDLTGRLADARNHSTRGRQAKGRASAAHSGVAGHDKKKSLFQEFFRRFAHKTSTGVGSPWAFALACAVILAWAVTGPAFGFSDTWQLVINTGTTIVTFLMVFLIQNTQNRDATAIHLKLDELIRALKGARNKLVDIEELSDEELEKLRSEFRRLGEGNLDAHPYAERGDD